MKFICFELLCTYLLVLGFFHFQFGTLEFAQTVGVKINVNLDPGKTRADWKIHDCTVHVNLKYNGSADTCTSFSGSREFVHEGPASTSFKYYVKSKFEELWFTQHEINLNLRKFEIRKGWRSVAIMLSVYVPSCTILAEELLHYCLIPSGFTFSMLIIMVRGQFLSCSFLFSQVILTLIVSSTG